LVLHVALGDVRVERRSGLPVAYLAVAVAERLEVVRRQLRLDDRHQLVGRVDEDGHERVAGLAALAGDRARDLHLVDVL